MLPFLLVILFFMFPAQAADKETYKGIKIGFEVEVTNPYKYVQANGEKGLRHKKLLRVLYQGRLLFWVEVDSSNRDIEIVTVPFKIPEEHELLERVLGGIDIFFDFLKKTTPSFVRNTQVPIDDRAIETLNTTLRQIGLIAELSTPFTLVVETKGELSLRPQISFQILLSKINKFFDYYLKDEKENFFTEEEKEIFKMLYREDNSIVGLTNLIIFYIENLKHKARSQQQSFHKLLYLLRIDAKKKALGEHLLVPLTNDLTPFDNLQQLFKIADSRETQRKIRESYINFHKGIDILQSQETGMKQFLPIMSRVAFSDLYKIIETSTSGRELKTFLRQKYGDLHSIIEFPYYAITKNPYYVGDHIQPSDFYYPYKYLSTDMIDNRLTIQQWLDSIISPTSSPTRPLGFRTKELSSMTKGLAKQNLKLRGFENTSSFIDYLRSIMMPTNNGKDLISPPAFTSYDESMGSLDSSSLERDYGEVVLEVRRYADFFNKKPKLRELKEFILVETSSIWRYLFIR